MFNSCLGQILFTFIVLPMLILLLWKTGILAEFRPVASLIIDMSKEILSGFIDFLQNPVMDYTDMPLYQSIY